MTTKHTPGPWRIEPTYQGVLTDKFKGFPYSINGANGFQPCLIYGDGKLNRGTAESNARLIAAAPDMLAALKDCAESMRVFLAMNGLNPTDNETYAAALAAIAKAEGLA